MFVDLAHYKDVREDILLIYFRYIPTKFKLAIKQIRKN